MANDVASPSDEAFRFLGRIWNRLFWSALFAVAILWDLLAAISVPPPDAIYTFGLGLATGMTFAGLVFTLSHVRRASQAS